MSKRSLSDCLNADDTLVLCATARLSAFVRQEQARLMREKSLKRWRTVQTLTVPQWLNVLREEVCLRVASPGQALQAMILTPVQERVVWERAIQQNLGSDASYIFDVAALAKAAMEAHELMVVWGVTVQAHQLTEESRRFLQWQKSFERRCEQADWVDRSRAQQALLTSVAAGDSGLRLPARVVFTGFSRYNPLEHQLRAVLIAQGVDVEDLEWGSEQGRPPATPQLRSYPDKASEVLAAALWVRDNWQANPDAELAIVVPDLAGTRHLLQDTLDDVLMPEVLSPSQAQATRPYNLSLGEPLAQHPMIGAALSLLQSLTNPTRVEQKMVSYLLRSPFWSAFGSEASARAQLDVAMRTRVAPTSTWAGFQSQWHRFNEKRKGGALDVPRLFEHVEACINAISKMAVPRSPSAWAGDFKAVLRDVGWLSGRKLSSHEYQMREAFYETLDQLGSLDECAGQLSFAQALGYLRHLSKERLFQARTEGHPRLQVLGLLEAGGLKFDGVWMMGLVDSSWPAPARPNPLLPSEAQRQARAPSASAEVQLEFARAVQSQLLQSASNVVLSWPRMSGASELKPSSLIDAAIGEHARDVPATPHWVTAAVRSGGAFVQSFDDAMAPEVAEGEGVSGGTWLLRAQAICPAWAFFQFRLGAGRLEDPQEGLDARARGNLVHDALEAFWKAIRSSEGLARLSPEQRQRAIEVAVDAALAKHDADSKKFRIPTRLRALERKRLCRLLSLWLDVEAQRQHAFTVIHTENKVEPSIEGLDMRMFIDRVDQLEDGSLLVIDYKTGSSIDTKNWASQRITEPQLPIYSAIAPPSEGPVKGVVFAKVLIKGPEWSGLSEMDKLLPKVQGLGSKTARKQFDEDRFPDWQSVLTHWRERLHAVAREVKAGEAGVRFEDEKALSYCDVLPLLRLSERMTQWEDAAQLAESNGGAQV
jgi:probable DNA repair protein